MNINTVAKTYGPLVVALLTAAFTFTQDNVIGGDAGFLVPVIALTLALLNVVITYRVENKPTGFLHYAKLIANIAHAGLQALWLILAGGIGLAELTMQDWSVVALALVGAAATWLLPNEERGAVIPADTES